MHAEAAPPRIVAVVFFAFAFAAEVRCAAAGDWPQWRGPRRDAASDETGLLPDWPEGGPKLAWQASGLGTGYSSVVVSRGRAFTIGKQGQDVVVTALQVASGKPEWTRKIGTTSRNPCSTPTVDDDRLYALDPDGKLVCLKAATGEILWQKSFLEDFGGRMMSGRGFGESPLVDGEKLICTPGGPDAALVALDKRTGKLLWKSKLLDIGSAGREGAGFSSVVVTEAAGIRQYVQLMGRGVVGFAAEDGRFLWGYNAIANGTANIPTPVVRDDLVFAANGYNAGSVLLRLVPDGQGIKAQEVYFLNGSQFQNHHGGVVLVGDHLYGGHGSNNGLPTCLELKTGNVVWKRRGPGVGSAAVVYADGRLYFRYQNGLVALIEASPSGYVLHGTLQIPGAGGDSWAHPIVANGQLYLREQDGLWVYDLHREPGTAAPADPAAPLPAPAAVLAALRKLGVSPVALSGDTDGRPAIPAALSTRQSEPEKARRLYAYAAAADSTSGKNTAEPTLLVVLTDKRLTPEGTLPTELPGLLKDLRMPLVVNLAGTRVGDAGLKQLAALDCVAGLNLELCGRVTDAGMESLQQLKQLRVLILAGTGITPAGIRNLVPKKSLTALDLEVCDGITDAACEALGEMRQLKALVVKKTGFEAKGITDAGLQHLQNLTELELLNLYGNRVTDAGLAPLERLVKLQELNLSLMPITDRGLVHLKPLRILRQLDLLYSEGFGGPTITNAGLAFLEPLASLNSLNLTGARLTDAGLDHFKPLKKLTMLQLARTAVTTDGLRALKAALPACEVVK